MTNKDWWENWVDLHGGWQLQMKEHMVNLLEDHKWPMNLASSFLEAVVETKNLVESLQQLVALLVNGHLQPSCRTV